MKRLPVLITLLLLLTVSVGHTQGSKDTTCLPNQQLKNALKLIEQGKVDKVELEQVKAQHVDLQKLLVSKERTIQSLEGQVKTKAQQVSNYQLVTSNHQGQLKMQEEAIKSLQKSLRSQKRKTAAIGIVGIVVTGSLLYLLVTK